MIRQPSLIVRWLAAVMLPCLGACAPPARRLLPLPEVNMLLIVLDTVGADDLGCYDPRIRHTPNIDRLAREGVRFSRAYTPAPWTQPAVASLFTSLMPSQHGTLRLNDTLAEKHATLAERLREAGYHTAGVVSHGLLTASKGFGQGFDDYDESSVGGHAAVTSELVTDRSISWLDRRSTTRPYFLFVHYFDAHAAYHHHPKHDLTSGYSGLLRPAQPIWELRDARPNLSDEDVRYIRGLYAEEIAHVDEHLGRLLDRVRSDADRRPTVVILTADHGEDLMHHGWIGHTRSLYDELLHVPLIISLPGFLPPAVDDGAASLLDVLPTLVGLVPSAPSLEPVEAAGVSLLAARRGEPALADRDLYAEVSFSVDPAEPARQVEKIAFKTALLRGDLKLIHDLLADRWELFDRATDPAEQHDLSRSDPGRVSMQRQLLAWERARETSGEPAPILPTTQEIDRLRALGYVE